MTLELKFDKTPTGRWFVDLPEWEGDPACLEMVEGADVFLDQISEGDQSIILLVALVDFHEGDTLYFEAPHELGGAVYLVKWYRGVMLNWKLWLCPVAEFVFGGILPMKIHFKRIQ